MPVGTQAISPARVEQCLGGITYPVSKTELFNWAKGRCDADVMGLLQNLPDQTYHAPTDVSKAIGKFE